MEISALVVDDYPLSLFLLQSALKELGCRGILGAENGDKAIDLARERSFNLIFLDIEMPGKGGLETLEELLKENPSQYVVMVSGAGTITNVKKAIALGAKGFLVKPYTTARIRDILSAYERGIGTKDHLHSV